MIEDDEKQGSMDENQGSMEENQGSMNEQILNAIHSGKMCTKLRKDCTADEKKELKRQ